MGVLFRKALAGTGGKTLVMNEVNDRRFCANEMSTEAKSRAGRSRGLKVGLQNAKRSEVFCKPTGGKRPTLMNVFKQKHNSKRKLK